MLWPINFFLHYPREVWLFPCSGLAVESVCFHTLLGSNQLTGANNCQNGLFKREMGPGGPLWLPACLFHPENPRVRILSHISSCCGDIESVSSGFRPERPRPGSQQSANRPLYGEIGSGPVIKSPFVRLWWQQCLQSAGLNSGHQLNLSEYNALQYISRFTFPQKVVKCNRVVFRLARLGQSECQLSGVEGGYKQYGGPILGRTMPVCRTKLENVGNNELQFSCHGCEPATWRPKAPTLP